ncbi:MAG: Gfo/Idh/MocA family oxidoreductase [Clostridia bacterium]|nr:Gfo/Idh/MocA family oxidoreductase [Clostridia bacterium]
MEKVRFGIIGVGNMGSSHAKNFLSGKVENGVLTAICDLKSAKTDKILAMEFDGAKDVAVFTDYKEMLASGLCDAVIVAVPHYDHPRLTIDALNAGMHVICEKPAGVYTKQVKEMNEVAATSDKLFTMMFNQRTNCVYRKMREMVQNGELGEIKRINWIITTWYRPQSYYDSGDWRATWRGEGGGVLFNQCPHQLDLLQWVTGMMPARVHSFCHFGKWHDIEVEDDVTAYLEYENGATGVFITSTGDTPGTNRFEILGDKGKLVCETVFNADGKKQDALTFTRLEMPEREFNATYKGGFGEPKSETVVVENDGKNEQHVGILNNFANAILGSEPLFVDGKEGIRGVELMDSMLLSTWLGKTVSLPIDDDLYLDELNKRIATGRKKESVDVVLDTEGTYK